MPEIDEKAFRKHLEWLVDQLPEDSAPYLEERPRFVHAVLVLADDEHEGEIIKASCIKQLDPEIIERHTKLTQIIETGNNDDQYVRHKSNALIDSGIHENQASSEEENDNLVSEQILPTQQLPYVPLSKYVQQPAIDPNQSNNSQSSNYYAKSFVVDNKLGQEREEKLFIDKDGSGEVPVYVKQDTGSTRQENTKFHDVNGGQQIKTEGYSYKIPQMQGTVYERPEIISRTYRSHVEETTFPSIDRYRTVRSTTVRLEPHSPRTLLNSTPLTPLESKTIRTTTETYTHTAVPQPGQRPGQQDDVIAQAVQILQSSCDMLDETVDRIQRRKLLNGQNSAFNFPSENRKPKTTA